MSTARTDDSEFWTPREAAAYLRRSVGTLRSWVRRGLLDVYRVAGGRPLYRRDDIRRMVVGVQREAYSLRVSDVAQAIAVARMQHGLSPLKTPHKRTCKNADTIAD